METQIWDIFFVLTSPFTETRIYIHLYHKSKCTRIFNKKITPSLPFENWKRLPSLLVCSLQSPPSFCFKRFYLFSVISVFSMASLSLTCPFNWCEGSCHTTFSKNFIYSTFWGSFCLIFYLLTFISCYN